MRCFIGWDSREIRAFNVCRYSLQRHCPEPIEANPLMEVPLRKTGYYTRTYEDRDGALYDTIDGKPFSTEFAFTRFLVPELCGFDGWALFMDCDMLIRGDVSEVFEMADPKYAVMCVKHKHKPLEKTKMDGAPQQQYRRKNWSSFVLWNCSHPSNAAVTREMVNTSTGQYLHAFEWLDDELIGELPHKWNWLEGHSSRRIKPKNVHFTRGGPWFPEWQDVEYGQDWRAEERRMLGKTASEWPRLEAV